MPSMALSRYRCADRAGCVPSNVAMASAMCDRGSSGSRCTQPSSRGKARRTSRTQKTQDVRGYKVANLSPPSLFARSSKTALFFYFLFFGMFIIKESKLTIKESAFTMLESMLNSEKSQKTLVFEKKMYFLF